jgi:WD40 repeat protein
MSKTQTAVVGPMPAKAGPPNTHSYFMSYPLFCVGTDGEGLIITGGGGGGKAYGVINYLQAHVAIQNESTGNVTMETIASMDTGSGAAMALDYIPSQGGVWICGLGSSCLIFKFNDDSLSMEPLFKFRSETNAESHLSNFAKLADINGQIFCLTGGEDKVLRLWRIEQAGGTGTPISGVKLVKELTDHQSEIVDADWSASSQQFLSCGKDGTVKVWSMNSSSPIVTLQPPKDKRVDEKLNLSIRSAYFVNNVARDIVVLCHYPRGPAYLMVFSQSNPTVPITSIVVSRTITPSMGIHPNRDRVAISHAGGEKDIYAVPSCKLISRTAQHCHEMPPCKTVFVNNNLVVSGSPDFSLNFFDPRMNSSSFIGKLFRFILILLIITLLAVLVVILFFPSGADVLHSAFPDAMAMLKRDEL